MEGFSVFKDSKSKAAASVNEENHPPENDPSEEKKEFYRKLEVLIALWYFIVSFVNNRFNFYTTRSLFNVHSLFIYFFFDDELREMHFFGRSIISMFLGTMYRLHFRILQS